MAGTRIESLLSEQLNAVSFVMDYVEFHFNGPVLRALSNPALDYQGHRVRFPDAGSRDALCTLIGSEVTSIDVRKHDRIELRTKQGHILTIPLDGASYRGAEAAHFIPADASGQLQVADMMIW